MNQYFLLIACLQLWSLITPVNPASTWGPLIFIFAVSATKEAWDDYNRFLSDKQANQKEVWVVKEGIKKQIQAQDIRVGNIVWLRENDETAALDGETDLKIRAIPSACTGLTSELLHKIKVAIECPNPDKDIRRFDANLRSFPPFIDNDVCPLTINNTLLQSCYLRNTEWACGVAVYTGPLFVGLFLNTLIGRYIDDEPWIALIVFSFISGVSGTSLFNSVSLMAYNVFYTSIPVLVSFLDKDLSERTVMQHPQILFYCQAGSSFTILQHLAIWGNLGAFYIINYIVSAIPSAGMYTVMFRLCQQPSYWITMFLIVIVGMGPVMALKYFRFTYRSSAINKLQQAEPMLGPILSLSNVEPQVRSTERDVTLLSLPQPKTRDSVHEPLLSESTRRSSGQTGSFDFFPATPG